MTRRRAAALLGFVALAAACDDELPTTVIEPARADPCPSYDCSTNGVCAADGEGMPRCVCALGYAGERCDRCDVSAHRDALERCVFDILCAEQASDPCAPHGQCVDGDGVLACECEPYYQGPRCNLCNADHAWNDRQLCVEVIHEPDASTPLADAGIPEDATTRDASATDAGGLDAAPADAGDDAQCSDTGLDGALPDSGPRDAGTPEAGTPEAGAPDAGTCRTVTFTESFDSGANWPAEANTCASHTSLTVTNLRLRSLGGSGQVNLCAPSSYNGIASRYVELRAGPERAADITLSHAASSVQFRYGATLAPLSLDVLADGQSVRTLELAAKSSTTATITLSTPARSIAFRSRSVYVQEIGLDDVAYTAVTCE